MGLSLRPQSQFLSTDDRGNAVELSTIAWAWRQGHWSRADAREFTRARGRQIVCHPRFILANVLFAVLLVAHFFVSIHFISPIVRSASPALQGALGGAIFGLPLILILALYFRTAGRIEAERLSLYLLQRSRCPSCISDLAALETESDGCTVCPECGAAWRLPPDQSSNPSS
jgi:hypothetical protein